jgi:transcriptional regulator with XRE-family HTH domain
MIGLKKVLEIFNKNPNQIANHLGVSRQTVYDWLKGKRKIPKRRITQLTQIPEFKFIKEEIFQKEIDNLEEHDIQIAYINYLSESETVEIDVNGDGIPVKYDPYTTERNLFIELKDNKMQLNSVSRFLNDQEFVDELNSEYGVIYSDLLISINRLFEEKQYEQIAIVSSFIKQLLQIGYINKHNNEFVNDIKEVLNKHNLFIGDTPQEF